VHGILAGAELPPLGESGSAGQRRKSGEPGGISISSVSPVSPPCEIGSCQPNVTEPLVRQILQSACLAIASIGCDEAGKKTMEQRGR
jgi:hypothetical protein